jgi:protein-S-isoprenylcysteine O-methyltransferase Ste14
MSPLSPLRRRAPWIAGAVLLAVVGLPLVAAALRFDVRWPYLVGAGALLVLLAGSLERWWQSRPLPRPAFRARSKARSRFRVVDGGRASHGPLSGPDADEENDDEPKWLM